MSDSVATSAPHLADRFVQMHDRLLADHSLQFSFTSFVPPPVPGWLKTLLNVLAWIVRFIAPLLQWLFWLGLAVVAGMILYFVGRELIRLRWPAKRRTSPAALAAEWRPEPAKARALLEDADRMAGEGRFTEAVHLLLFRSIEDIDSRLPRMVRPALTARDILHLCGLPEAARAAFATITQAVERSIFGGRDLDATVFAECRKAYETFAFPGAWA